MGLQNKSIDNLATEFNMPSNQLLAKFFDCIKKLTRSIISVMELSIESKMDQKDQFNVANKFEPLNMAMNEELEIAAEELKKKQKIELLTLKNEKLNEYAIKGTEEDWNKALVTSKSKIISVKM